MRLLRTIRFSMLALVVLLAGASMHAQLVLSISAGFAPPALPVYVQPPCPEANLMWTPGYWAYAADAGDYYWVPGAWVPAPYSGALWTPPYWGWANGNYGFNAGYWGRTVGFYGGVNYGYGFGGIGFAGGEWRGGSFAYNTAVTQVDVTVIHTTYVNRTIVETGTVANPRHVAFNGGPGGIQHTPTRAEKEAATQPHTPPTEVQTGHTAAARADKTSFAKANGGHPATLAVARPQAKPDEAAPAAKDDAKPAAKNDAAPAARTEPKAEAKPVANAAPKAGTKTAPKADARPIAKAAPKPAAKPAPKAAPKDEPKPTNQ
ncbi:MAG: YXWGXW repeat-containing protein [Acidobacteriaceae bacterium]